MILKAISFNPLKYELNGIEVPVVEHSYQDENDKPQKISYVVIDGEKVAIHHEAEISEKLRDSKVDEALQEVEVERISKLKPEIK